MSSMSGSKPKIKPAALELKCATPKLECGKEAHVKLQLFSPATLLYLILSLISASDITSLASPKTPNAHFTLSHFKIKATGNLKLNSSLHLYVLKTVQFD